MAGFGCGRAVLGHAGAGRCTGPWRPVARSHAWAAGRRAVNPITSATTYEAGGIVKVDEAAGVMFYMGRDGDNYSHSGVNQQRMMEFFIENLIQHPERLLAPGGS